MFFFFNDTATTEIYTLSLHDALPIFFLRERWTLLPVGAADRRAFPPAGRRGLRGTAPARSEEHTSELQSQSNLVCRLLLEKKKSHRNSMDGSRVDVANRISGSWGTCA